MKIRFVSHASFCLESNGTTLLCDPWLFGKAFNQGWALLSPAASVPWEEIDYVWISHQHPDHFHFPTLKSLLPEQRKRLTMLYHKHASSRIPRVLQGLGYSTVRELTLHKWIPLRDGMEVMNGSAGSMDSWLAIRAEGIVVLNLNDCVLSHSHLAHIARMVGKVTILLTQFSFATWIGNHADELGEVDRKLRDLRHRVNFLNPEATIPFASFAYFCNQENKWMNEFSVTPQRVADLGLPGVHFMYPGDEWDSNKRTFRSAQALERYMRDVAKPKVIDATPPAVAIATVRATVDRMLRRARTRFGKLLIGRIKPFTIYLHDLDRVLIVNPANGCDVQEATKETRDGARYLMCSQVAWYAFAYSWGWGALEDSGMYLDRRFREPNWLAFYLNIMSTEFVGFGNIQQTIRTLQFFWEKKKELAYRACDKLVGSGYRAEVVGGAREVAGGAREVAEGTREVARRRSVEARPPGRARFLLLFSAAREGDRLHSGRVVECHSTGGSSPSGRTIDHTDSAACCGGEGRAARSLSAESERTTDCKSTVESDSR